MMQKYSAAMVTTEIFFPLDAARKPYYCGSKY
jgi:hypothetical protein